MELLTEFTTGYWWGSWNCLPSSPRIIGEDRGTVYRVHHGLLVGSWNYLPSSPRVIGGGRETTYRVHHGLFVGVVELLTEFTTDYWWGSWNCLPNSPRFIGGGRGTVYRVHHGLLVGSAYRVHGLLVGVVELLTEFTTGYWWGS